MAEAGIILGPVPAAPRRGAAGMSLPVLTGIVPATDATSLAGEWSALAGRALEANPLFAPEFVLSASRHFGDRVAVAVVRSADGELIALAPVTRTRLGRIAPALRTWSHDYGPLGVPLFARGQAGEAASGLIEAAAGAALVVPDLTLDGPVAKALLAAAETAGRATTIVGAHQRAICRTEADPREALSAKRRKEYARQLRRLAEEASAGQETLAEPDAVASAFEEFLALEAAGWKGARGTALAAQEDKQAFAREAVAGLAARGAVRIHTLRRNGGMIAGLVSLLAGDRAVTWKIAYDEGSARFSPGAQVMLDAPRALAEAGIRAIDSLATPDHPLVNHIWKDRAAVGTLIVAPAGGRLRHRIALASVAAERKARRLAKRLLERVRG